MAQWRQTVRSWFTTKRSAGLLLLVFGGALISFGRVPVDLDLASGIKIASSAVGGWTFACLGVLLATGYRIEQKKKKIVEVICEFVFAIGVIFSLGQALASPYIHFMGHMNAYSQADYRRAIYDLQFAYIELCIPVKQSNCQSIEDIGHAVSSWDGAPLRKFIDGACPLNFDPWHPPAGLNYHLRDACSFVIGLERSRRSPNFFDDFKSDSWQIDVLLIIAMFVGLRFALMVNELISPQ